MHCSGLLQDPGMPSNAFCGVDYRLAKATVYRHNVTTGQTVRTCEVTVAFKDLPNGDRELPIVVWISENLRILKRLDAVRCFLEHLKLLE